MDIKDNSYIWFGISTLIIISMIYFADIGKFIESVRTAKLLPLIPALILGLAVFPTWSYVWYRVFKKSKINTPYRKSLNIFMAGNFMNSITPLGQAGGEPVMAYLLEDNSDASYEKSISSIFSADVINGTPVITFVVGGAAYLAFFESLNQAVLQGVYVALTATVLGGALMYLLWFESGKIEGAIIAALKKFNELTGRGESFVKSIEEKLQRLEETFADIGEDPVYLFKTAVVAHIGFLLQIFNFYFIMIALGFTPDLTPIYFIVVFSGLANFSPTPGGSGTFEAAMAGLTTVFLPVSFATGLTAGILFRLTTYWPGILLGYISLNSLNGKVMKD
jgi:uncharacterized protein (TIRG00374 family)